MAISLDAATYFGLALEARHGGDEARFAECIASIDDESWEGLRTRFSQPMGWMNLLDDQRVLTAGRERPGLDP